MKAIIISGGKFPSKKLLCCEIEDGSIIICADSGANCLYNYGITPNYIMGDFDSIDNEVLDYYKRRPCIIEKFPVEKDYTDTELALLKAIELGVDNISFLGCTGTRLDHVFGNIGLLNKCLESNINGFLKDDNNTITLINKPIKLKGDRGKVFSVQAYNETVKNLCINGAKYNLENYDLQVGNPLTISNEFYAQYVNISFQCGTLLIFYSRD